MLMLISQKKTHLS